MAICESANASLGDASRLARADDEADTMRPVRRNRFGPLWLQVLVAVIVGVLIGVYCPDTGAALKPLSDGFVMLIRMALAAIIFGAVVVGIAKMGDLHEVGRSAPRRCFISRSCRRFLW
jgi:hypothetical protein